MHLAHKIALSPKPSRGSANRHKAARRLARLHSRTKNIRQNGLHKLSTRLCRENQAVSIEDLEVQGMLKNRKLSRAISDMGWGEIRRQSTYKAPMFGTRLNVIGRWTPSSKMCSQCGAVKRCLTLGERIYVCTMCGFREDRDVNAARNINQLGSARPEVTSVEIGALAVLRDGETLIDEAEISKARKCAPRR